MKKLFAIVMAVLMVALLAGCSAEELQAYVLYSAANQKLEEAGSMEATVAATIQMELAGQTAAIAITGDTKQITHSEDDVEMEIAMAQEVSGQTVETSIYYRGGTAYFDVMGQKYKQQLPASEVSIANYNLTFDENSVKEMQVSETEDGGYDITFQLDGEDLLDQLGAQLAGMAGAESEDAYDIGDVEMQVTIDGEGDLRLIELGLPFTIGVQDQQVNCIFAVVMEIVQIGDVTIDAPSDLDSYQELEVAA